MTEKIKGINLGGWLVLEKWMSPKLFEDVAAEDEYYLAHDLSESEYKARIKVHRSEFITETDFLRLSSAGFNLIRIPVPYFIFGDRLPFIGCIEELDRAFNWAEAYGVRILLDLHTAPFSQNAFDNGGLSGVCRWAQMPKEVEFELTVLTRLAERYKNHAALWGIEVINEPITKRIWKTMNPQKRYIPRDLKLAVDSAPISLEFLQEFYKEAYFRLRNILPEETVISFHDGFELHSWKEFFKENDFKNVMLDTHQYVMIAELKGTPQSLEAYKVYLDDLGKQIAEVQKYVPVFVGEWSLFNSYTAGVDTKGGINPTQEEFLDKKIMSKNELAMTYLELWNASVKAWNQGEGHIYWTYKLNIDTVNEPAWYGRDSWDMSRCLINQWVDPMNDIKY